jgi:hypothetical protein
MNEYLDADRKVNAKVGQYFILEYTELLFCNPPRVSGLFTRRYNQPGPD